MVRLIGRIRRYKYRKFNSGKQGKCIDTCDFPLFASGTKEENACCRASPQSPAPCMALRPMMERLRVRWTLVYERTSRPSETERISLFQRSENGRQGNSIYTLENKLLTFRRHIVCQLERKTKSRPIPAQLYKTKW